MAYVSVVGIFVPWSVYGGAYQVKKALWINKQLKARGYNNIIGQTHYGTPPWNSCKTQILHFYL